MSRVARRSIEMGSPGSVEAVMAEAHVTLLDNLAFWNDLRQIAAIPAVLGPEKRSCTCWVSREALEDLEGDSGLDSDQCLRAVGRHRERLAAIAARKLEEEGLDPDQRIRVSSADL
jgi:hypothetical protein